MTDNDLKISPNVLIKSDDVFNDQQPRELDGRPTIISDVA